jgi:hypothetical protein
VDARQPKEIIQQEIRSKLGLPPRTPAEAVATAAAAPVPGAVQ